MNKFTKQIIPATEIIMGIITTGLCSQDRKAIIDDPKTFIHSRTKVDIGHGIDVQVVKNEADTVHITLPYYDSLDASNVQALNMEDLQEVSGGEIVAHLEKQGMNVLKEGVYKDNGMLNGSSAVGYAVVEQHRNYILRTQGLMPRDEIENEENVS